MKYQTFINTTFAKSASGSITPRINIPITVLKDMGVTESNKTLSMEYNPEKNLITLSKYEPLETFDIDFEYEFVKKINDCYDKIMNDYFISTGITGSKWTYTRRTGGKQIANKYCERDDKLLFDEKIKIQVILRKREILLYIDKQFFNGKRYSQHVELLEKGLRDLCIKNNMKLELTSEIIKYM